MPTSKKSFDPETFVREAYAAAERMDLKGWKSLFALDGIFTDQSVGVTYQGPDLDYPVRQYGTAFGDMHRELYNFWTVGDTVIVRLAQQGTHTGPFATPFGTLPPTGNRMDAPCADIFEIGRSQNQEVRLLPGRFGDSDSSRRHQEPCSSAQTLSRSLEEPAPRFA